MIPDVILRWLRSERRIVIDPYNDDDVQPVSYDLHLGADARVEDKTLDGIMLDLATHRQDMYAITIPNRDAATDIFCIMPGQFMLGCTLEKIGLEDDIGAEFMGKSTLGRAGLFVHVTAGLVDPGWGRGHRGSMPGSPLTVEMLNVSSRPLRLWAGMPIGQLVVTELSLPAQRSYGDSVLNSHYYMDDTVRTSKGLPNGR